MQPAAKRSLGSLFSLRLASALEDIVRRKLGGTGKRKEASTHCVAAEMQGQRGAKAMASCSSIASRRKQRLLYHEFRAGILALPSNRNGRSAQLALPLAGMMVSGRCLKKRSRSRLQKETGKKKLARWFGPVDPLAATIHGRNEKGARKGCRRKSKRKNEAGPRKGDKYPVGKSMQGLRTQRSALEDVPGRRNDED